MGKTQGARVQRHARRIEPIAPPVAAIAEDRMPPVAAVDANLMGATGLEPTGKDREPRRLARAADPLEDGGMGNRALASHGILESARCLRDVSRHCRNVFAFDVMHPKQLGKRPVRRVRFGERQQATGLQIQPMDHHHGGLVTSARQKIGKIVSIAFGGGRREQPRRLKGDHQVRVFENHPMGRQFALDAGSRLLAGSPTGAVERPPQVRHDSLARTDLAARDFNPRAIDEDATDVEQNSGLATRKLWHMLGKSLIQSHAGRVIGNGKLHF